MQRNESIQSVFKEFLLLRSRFEKNVEALAETMDLNKSELLLILDLIEHPDTSLNEACQRLGLKKSAASKLVDRLVDREYVARVQCPTNRREIQLSVGTGFGQESFCKNQAIASLFPYIKAKTVDELVGIAQELNALRTALFGE